MLKHKDIIHLERVVVQGIDAILGEPIQVLDKGFVRVIDYLGSDASIVQGARVSYGKGTKTVNEDKGLIDYLMRNNHTSPFEMCEIKFHIKLPIFVARQWIRHRTANVNEYSARYSILPDDFYVPALEDVVKQSKFNKQGGGEGLGLTKQMHVQREICNHSKVSYNLYQMLLSEEYGLSRELARLVLPVNFYTEWYWKIDLHNLLHFLHLRLDTHAQLEIRKYAQVILQIVEKWCPLTAMAFKKHKLKIGETDEKRN